MILPLFTPCARVDLSGHLHGGEIYLPPSPALEDGFLGPFLFFVSSKAACRRVLPFEDDGSLRGCGTPLFSFPCFLLRFLCRLFSCQKCSSALIDYAALFHSTLAVTSLFEPYS